MKDYIQTERTLIRPIKQTDAYAVFLYRSLPEIARYQYWEPYTVEDAKVFVEKCNATDLNTREKWIGLLIEDRQNANTIGDCALRIDQHMAEVGCNISPQYQKKGFAKEVLAALIRYCFDSTDVNEVFGITDSDNLASVKMMESLGMKKAPDFEEKVMCKGDWCIEHKYVIRRDQ